MISVTSSSTSNVLGKATNWFGFVGLTLDLIGTSAGVVRALLLQQAIRRSHRLAVRLSGQIDGARHEVREQQQRRLRHATSLDPRSHAFLTDSMRAISRVMAIFAEDGRFGMQAAATGAQPVVDLDSLGHPRLSLRGKGGFHPVREWMQGILLHVDGEGIGYVPIVSMAGGGLCLLVSVVLYAGASQPHFVWISCASVAAGILIWSVFPTTNPHSTSASFPDCAKEVADHVREQSAAAPLFTTM
jgi:hypothetical protein